MIDANFQKTRGFGRCIYCGSCGTLKDEHIKGHHPSANLLMAHYARRVAGDPEESGSSSTAEGFKAEMEALFAEITAKSQPAVAPQSEAKKADDTEDDVAPPDETPPATEH